MKIPLPHDSFEGTVSVGVCLILILGLLANVLAAGG